MSYLNNTDKKILCILNTFFNYEHIQQCFDSIYNENIDYFILENKSKYSDKIEEYFKSKKLLGYIQAQDNVTHGTVDYFFKNYKELINKYDYMTLTDGDVLVDDIDSLYEEIITILDCNNVKLCCINLDRCNLPPIKGSERWIEDGPNIENIYIKARSGTHMMTFKNDNFNIITNLDKVIDGTVHAKVKSINGILTKTIKNVGTHLTWDYYYDGNEYYEWKKNNQWTLGTHDKLTEMKHII